MKREKTFKMDNTFKFSRSLTETFELLLLLFWRIHIVTFLKSLSKGKIFKTNFAPERVILPALFHQIQPCHRIGRVCRVMWSAGLPVMWPNVRTWRGVSKPQGGSREHRSQAWIWEVVEGSRYALLFSPMSGRMDIPPDKYYTLRCLKMDPRSFGGLDKTFLRRLLYNTKSLVFEATRLLLKLWSLGFDNARLLFSIKYHWSFFNVAKVATISATIFLHFFFKWTS